MPARIVIVGRPNVGKSTLFNRLLGARIAITDSRPGITRDFVIGTATIGDRKVELIDTGGIGDAEDALIDRVRQRSTAEIPNASVVVVVLDVTEITGDDQEVLDIARRANLPTVVVANKVDTEKREAYLSQVWEMGVDDIIPVSAEHGHGIDDLRDRLSQLLDSIPEVPNGGGDDAEGSVTGSESGEDDGSDAGKDWRLAPVRLAIVGKPNTGKSSMLNRLVNQERALVSELPGTTRDRVEAQFDFRGTHFIVTDTAGIRRRSRVEDAVEYYSVTRALQAIEQSEVVILMVDATTGLTDQDKKIAAEIAKSGKGVIVALNKWDLTSQTPNQLEAMRDRIAFIFPVFRHVPVLPVSAATGFGVEDVLNRLLLIRKELNLRIETAQLNQALQEWMERTPPPTEKGKRWKVRYITQVQVNPVRFVMFVNRERGFPDAYVGFVRNQIRTTFGFHHIPFFIEVRHG